MALSNSDLEKIAQIIDTRVAPIEIKVDRTYSELLTVKLDVRKIRDKVNQIWKTENEDILSMNVIVSSHTKQIAKINKKVRILEKVTK